MTRSTGRNAAQFPCDLAAVAQLHGLSDSVVDHLCGLCSEFKADTERGRRTKKMQSLAMRAIQRKARELRALLDALPNGEFMSLDHQLLGLGVPEALHAQPLFSRGTMAQRTLCSLAVAAGRVAERVEARGLLGRRETLGFSVSLVACIAFRLKDAGIAPNRNEVADGTPSPFREICSACFTAAGIPSGPEAAIQVFMASWATDYKAKGFCL